MGVRFSNKMVAELYQPFWAALQAGEFLTDAAAFAGTHRWRRLKWLREAGGVRPRRGRDPQGRYLSFAEREEIALGRAAGESVRSIAARLGRSPSTVSRELARTAQGGKAGYRATSAHALTYVRAGQPTHTCEAGDERGAAQAGRAGSVEAVLAGADRRPAAPAVPGPPEMWVSTETIYQSLYVQSRGQSSSRVVAARQGRWWRRPPPWPGPRRQPGTGPAVRPPTSGGGRGAWDSPGMPEARERRAPGGGAVRPSAGSPGAPQGGSLAVRVQPRCVV